MRGGVSIRGTGTSTATRSSPRAWGCFRLFLPAAVARVVFPTCVGVFPPPICSGGDPQSLPHVRGGVSDENRVPARARASSPRAWGCFLDGYRIVSSIQVFPTCVGVFPRCPARIQRPGRLPHVRGGDRTPITRTRSEVGFPYNPDPGRSPYEAQAVHREADHRHPQGA